MANQDLNIWVRIKDQATKDLNNIRNRFTNFSNTFQANWASITAGVYLVKRSFDVLSRSIKDVINEANRQEDAIKRLNIALQIQGTFTKDLSKKYVEFSDAMQKTTRFGDEGILEVMQTLVSVGNVAPAKLEEATQAVLDFATATGRDLQTSALTVAKASAGFTGELSRYGIIIDENIPKTEKFSATLKFINERFGGSAQKDISTFAGLTSQLSNAWSDFKEELGNFIIKSPKVKRWIEDLKNAVIDFSEALADARIGYAIDNIDKLSKKYQEYQKILLSTKYGQFYVKDAMQKSEKTAKDLAGTLTMLAESGLPFFDKWKAVARQLPTELYQQVVDAFNKGINLGEINVSPVKQTFKFMEYMAEESAKNIQDAFANFFFKAFTGEMRNLREVFNEFGRSILQVLSNALAQKVFASTLGKMSFFSGTSGHQLGSPYIPNTGLYMLHKGEQVVPAHQNAGGGQQIYYYINAVDPRSFADLLHQNRAGIHTIVQDGIKNNGSIRGSIKKYG